MLAGTLLRAPKRLFERRSDWSYTVEAHQRIDLLAPSQGVSRLLANELLKSSTTFHGATRARERRRRSIPF
jgi:hypothetical protein